jgi:hypothetical protein
MFLFCVLLLYVIYRYSVAVAVASVFVVLWAGIQVGKARKRFNIQYPQVRC